MQRPQGLKTYIRNFQRKPRICASGLTAVAYGTKMTKSEFKYFPNGKKRKPLVWEPLLKLMRGLSISRIIAHNRNYASRRQFTVFGEGFAKELTAEPQWAKCSERWSLSVQVPPLVPMAKAKLNLLSAPLKLVSQDSELPLPSITSAGTKRRLPKGVRITAICIHTLTIKALQSRSDSLHFPISELSSKWNTELLRLPITVFFKKREQMRKSQNANYSGSGFSSHDPSEETFSCLFCCCFHVTLLFQHYLWACMQLSPPPVQSVNPAEVCDISCTKADFNLSQMRLKNKYTLQQPSPACDRLSWVKNELSQTSVMSLCIEIRWLAVQLTLKSQNNKTVHQTVKLETSPVVYTFFRRHQVRIKPQIKHMWRTAMHKLMQQCCDITYYWTFTKGTFGRLHEMTDSAEQRGSAAEWFYLAWGQVITKNIIQSYTISKLELIVHSELMLIHHSAFISQMFNPAKMKN